MTAATMPVFAPPLVARNPFQPMVQARAEPQVSVICPVFNQIEVTIDFVINLSQYVKPPNELIVVANGCTDATAAFLAQWKRAGHNIKPIISERNRGFGGGNNFGAREAENDVWLFLSNDVRATGDFIPSILDALRFHPRAVVGAKLLNYDTGWNTYITNGELRLSNRTIPSGERFTVPYLEGWCIAVDSRYCHKNKPQDKSQTGGLWDERYFPCDAEDIDICLQAHINGCPLVEIKELPLKHEHTGQTANNLPGGRLKHTLANIGKLCKKYNLSFIR